MKFAKKLETDTENLPDELRQHLIRYKYLKKAISKIVDEMEQRGLSATLLSEWLRKSSDETEGEGDNSLKIEYFFVGKFICTETMKIGKHITDAFWAQKVSLLTFGHALELHIWKMIPAYSNCLNQQNLLATTKKYSPHLLNTVTQKTTLITFR